MFGVDESLRAISEKGIEKVIAPSTSMSDLQVNVQDTPLTPNDAIRRQLLLQDCATAT